MDFSSLMNMMNLGGMFGMGKPAENLANAQPDNLQSTPMAPITNLSTQANAEDIARINSQENAGMMDKYRNMMGVLDKFKPAMAQPQEMAPVQFQENRLFSPPPRQEAQAMNPYASISGGQKSDMQRLISALRGD